MCVGVRELAVRADGADRSGETRKVSSEVITLRRRQRRRKRALVRTYERGGEIGREGEEGFKIFLSRGGCEGVVMRWVAKLLWWLRIMNVKVRSVSWNLKYVYIR